MKSFEIIATQTPGIVQFSNYEEIKAALVNYADGFLGIDYSNEGVEAAERDSKELKAHKDTITKVKKEINAAYSAPYIEIEKKLDELTAILDVPLKKAKSYVDETSKKGKEKMIMDYAQKASLSLGAAASKVIGSGAFFNPKWLNKTTSMKSIQDDIDGIVRNAAKDIKAIQNTGGEQTGVLLARYYDTLSMDGMEAFIESINDESDLITEQTADSVKNVSGYKILKITATEDQMAFVMTQLKLMGLEVEEIEDGMPKAMEEINIPDFDSFVAFDIETTGTNGAVNGDKEAKITEIGAVKIEKGAIVDKFDELANPGWKIIPRIARLTNITDEMVADKPPVEEVIRLFKDFIGDSILVGHNIKSSDLRYITKAADLAGIKIENRFFDTYIAAKTFKKENGWEKLNLGYLAEQFGLKHDEAHRAWSDAEVNAHIYFELHKLYMNSENKKDV